MEISAYRKIDEVAAEAAQIVGDMAFKKQPIGWYRRRIKDALTDVNFEIRDNLETHTMPVCPEVKMPSGVFDIKQVYLHNDSICDIKKATRVDYKRNAIATSNSFRADIAPGDSAIGGHEDKTGSTGTNVHWISVYNDKIQLSPSCQKFKYITITVSGLWMEINNIPIVPEYLFQACVTYTEREFMRIQKNRDPREWRALYNDSVIMYNQAKETAMVFASRMGTLERKRTTSYLKSFYTK